MLLLSLGVWLASATQHGHPLGFSSLLNRPRPTRSSASSTNNNPLITDCKEKYFTQTIDHFNWESFPKGKSTFQQRFFVCDKYWKPQNPIFFYTGNEANVELYINHTGLMWESAPEFGALLVFAEHRYYGKSQPFPSAPISSNLSWLTTEQALADFATLIRYLKQTLQSEKSAVIGFGGSYGGMLASWFRIKYPWLMDGAIAGSAPIWAYLNLDPPYNSNSYAELVTYDASVQAGSAPRCAENVRRTWPLISKYAGTDAGRKTLQSSFKLCYPLNTTNDGWTLSYWLDSAWSYLAMGNYPYPSDYITNGEGILPAFPVRLACDYLKGTLTEDSALFIAMRQAVAIFYNVSETAKCFDLEQSANNETLIDGQHWDYQACTEQVMPFSRTGVKDMFWKADFNLDDTIKGCEKQWGVTPRSDWISTEFGGKALQGASNIVFSNGEYDPWAGGGVLTNFTKSNIFSIMIPEAAHHLDFMFSTPLDPPALIAARKFEKDRIREWINNH